MRDCDYPPEMSQSNSLSYQLALSQEEYRIGTAFFGQFFICRDLPSSGSSVPLVPSSTLVIHTCNCFSLPVILPSVTTPPTRTGPMSLDPLPISI